MGNEIYKTVPDCQSCAEQSTYTFSQKHLHLFTAPRFCMATAMGTLGPQLKTKSSSEHLNLVTDYCTMVRESIQVVTVSVTGNGTLLAYNSAILYEKATYSLTQRTEARFETLDSSNYRLGHQASSCDSLLFANEQPGQEFQPMYIYQTLALRRQVSDGLGPVWIMQTNFHHGISQQWMVKKQFFFIFACQRTCATAASTSGAMLDDIRGPLALQSFYRVHFIKLGAFLTQMRAK